MVVDLERRVVWVWTRDVFVSLFLTRTEDAVTEVFVGKGVVGDKFAN